MKRTVAILLVMFMFTSSGVVFAQPQLDDFADIRGHWAEEYITKASDLGLMYGVGTNDSGQRIFAPEDVISRAQLAVVLQNTFQLDYDRLQYVQEPLASDYYQDIDNTAWYAKAVVMGAINKIFPAADNFSPQIQVSRLEIAQAVQRSFDAKGISIPMIMMMPIYEDTQSLSPEATSAVAFVSNTGIMQGSHNYFRPESNMTRAELATVLVKCDELIKSNQSPIALQGSSIKKESEYMSVDLNIPVIIPVTQGLIDDAILTQINTRWENQALDLEKELMAGLTAYVEYSQQNDFPIRPYNLTSQYQLGLINDSLLSLYIDYYQYTGGAHGTTNRIPYNIDLQTGRDVALHDIFQSDYDYQAIIDAEVKSQIALEPDIYFDGDMGFKGITPDQDYYLQEDFLVVYFQQYEIAPYSSGIREFKIPLIDLQDGIRSDLEL